MAFVANPKPKYKGKWIANFSEFADNLTLLNSSLPADDTGYQRFERKTRKGFERSMDATLIRLQKKCSDVESNER